MATKTIFREGVQSVIAKDFRKDHYYSDPIKTIKVLKKYHLFSKNEYEEKRVAEFVCETDIEDLKKQYGMIERNGYMMWAPCVILVYTDGTVQDLATNLASFDEANLFRQNVVRILDNDGYYTVDTANVDKHAF